MINYLKTSVIFTLCCSLPVCAIELNLGLQLTTNNIDVRDESDQNIAQMNNKLALSPTVSLLSKGYYLSEQSSLGVQFQLDGNLVKVNRQTLHQNNQLTNLDTKISGYALYAMPLFFYHFNRHQPEKWQVKTGIGIGLGYLNLSGNYQITQPLHPEFGETKNIKLSEFGQAVGVYLEIKKGKHAFLLYNFSPYVNNSNYQFQEHNAVLAYRYTINLNHLFTKTDLP
ncbi:hypothetical protein P0E95_001171 [Vibrio metschnikovii]|uniref:hypothetical protein n=1 Tax=Vibrio metschnikovii TaxID=28172 RepID=UPI001C2F6BEC|nr:hypothetical protein [Vibrio metschnikovii]EKO3564839.1 hypothetical protein [Vibrio metschnikovii]EKO3770070.1 hypothetical protein [Vibrio metschnikovii]